MAANNKRALKRQNIRLPLIGSQTNRSGTSTKDQRFINIYPETRKVDAIESTRIFLNKRPGLTTYKDFGTGEGRGTSWFNGKFYVAVGNQVIEDSGSPTVKITLTASTGPIGMILGNSTTVGDYLFICDGTGAWVINTSGTVTTISSGAVISATVATAGSGYTGTPYVFFTGGGGSGATATATISSGAVTAVDITDGGTGYSSEPTVSFGFTVTATNATDVFNATAHVLVNTDRVAFTTTGTLPTGITAGVAYYVVNKATNTFQVSLTSGGAAVTFTTDGTGTITANTGGPTTTIAEATSTLNSFPTPHVAVPTFIDGYILLAKGSDVYNCVLDEPTRWDSSNYLTAEMFPDAIVSLARQNNQVVVFGEHSIEFFYDAANINGSPLARNDSTTIQIGCAAPYILYQNENTFMFVGQSEAGGRAVWQVTGFQPKRISDEYVDRIVDAETDMSDCRGFGLRTMGHLMFAINLTTLGRTLVYDVDEKLWHEWSSNVAGSHGVFACNYLADNHLGAAYMLHISNGTLYKFDPTAFQDDATAILVEIQTNKFDMDTYKRKFMHSIQMVGDRAATGNSVDVKWSDDDYQTWSSTKTIALTDDFPSFARLGSYRRRAFNIRNALNYFVRLEALEVTYTEGDS
jgi:hypothetical protein